MLRILGDINFADGYFDQGIGVGTAIANGVDVFHKLPRNPNDFWIGNFECVCADIPYKNFPFIISPSHLSKIRHLDLYGIANNHIMQAGEDAFNQTIDFLENNSIRYAGANHRRSTTFNHQGKKVGFMAFSMRPDNFTKSPSYWHIPELIELEAELKDLEHCNFKIVYIHWGYEFINHPNIEQRQLAHWLIDKGADLIIGMHPHVMQGAEKYKGKYIFYSLGNSVFNMAWEPTRYGLILNVDLSKESPSVWSDYLIIGDDYLPEIVADVPKQYTLEYLDSLIGVTLENEKYFTEARSRNTEYTKANRKAIVKHLIHMSPKAQFALISDFINRRVLSK